jgi:hypothetical protein
MPITNRESGTNVEEIADGIYRISTPVPPSVIPGGFTCISCGSGCFSKPSNFPANFPGRRLESQRAFF